MLNHWLTPVQSEKLLQIASDHPHSLGAHLLDQASQPETVKVALIGTNAASSLSIRTHLYKLASSSKSFAVADLGNLRKSDLDFSIQLIRELSASGIIPIFLAPQVTFLQALFRGYAQKEVNLSLLSQAPNFKVQDNQISGALEVILKDKDLANFSLIGSQSHFIDTPTKNWMATHHFEQLRLGSLRGQISSSEPLIRDADLMAVHLDLLKQIEAPAQDPASPSGLFSEEACQLMRYAGMSDKLAGIGFFGYNPAADIKEQTAAVIAQLIWYFIEGISNRKGDFPVSRKNLVEYIVQPKNTQAPLVFWKSNRSGRWWLQVPEKMKLGKRHHLVPCSYENYVACTNDEIPDRLLRVLRRFD